MVVEGCGAFACGDVPDLDEAVTAGGDDLGWGAFGGGLVVGRGVFDVEVEVGVWVVVCRRMLLLGRGHPEDFEDAVGVAFEGTEAGVVVEAPNLNCLVAAACQDEASAGTRRSGVRRYRSCIFGGEGDGPNAASVTAEDTLDFTFLRGPDFDGTILRGGGKEGRSVICGDRIDVFFMGFTSIDCSRRFPIQFRE